MNQVIQLYRNTASKSCLTTLRKKESRARFVDKLIGRQAGRHTGLSRQLDSGIGFLCAMPKICFRSCMHCSYIQWPVTLFSSSTILHIIPSYNIVEGREIKLIRV